MLHFKFSTIVPGFIFFSTASIISFDGKTDNFLYDSGQVVLDTPFPVKNHQSCRISSIKPIAVAVSEGVQFVVKGFNLSRSTARYPSLALEYADFFVKIRGKFNLEEFNLHQVTMHSRREVSNSRKLC